MSVYTALDQETIAHYIDNFRIGPLTHFEGALDGIENTTYFVSTDQSQQKSEDYTAEEGNFVLTLFETLRAEQLPFFIELTTYLQEHELPVPSPLRDINGNALQTISNKPALLFSRVAGEHPAHPNKEQCQSIGSFLGKMHKLTSNNFDAPQNSRGFKWCCEQASQINEYLTATDNTLLNDTIDHLKPFFVDAWSLPRGVIHGDLFHDNALFLKNELIGVIDFYNASNEFLIFDLAITINDWCSGKDATLNHTLYTALLHGYQQERPLLDTEKAAWPHILQAAALRFWISRLLVKHTPGQSQPKGILTQHKDPGEYKDILQQRITNPAIL